MVQAMMQGRPEKALYGFEGIGEDLPYLPLAARRALDAWGKKLSLTGWLSLGIDDRWALVLAGYGEDVDGLTTEQAARLRRAVPGAASVEPIARPDASSPPQGLVEALGSSSRPLGNEQWRALRALDRYALVKYARKPEKLARAYDEIIGTYSVPQFTHLTSMGHAHMVDVGAKNATARRAIASARISTTRAVVAAIAAGELPKGDVLAVARVAGLLAAKRTPDLVPLCHPVQTTSAAVEFDADPNGAQLRIRATVEAFDRTGVEMEAMVAASVTALTVYDMIKSADRWATIDFVRLEEKTGGKSGHVSRPTEASDG